MLSAWNAFLHRGLVHSELSMLIRLSKATVVTLSGVQPHSLFVSSVHVQSLHAMRSIKHVPFCRCHMHGEKILNGAALKGQAVGKATPIRQTFPVAGFQRKAEGTPVLMTMMG